MAYCRCLQHWAEKRDPPINAEAHPLAKNMRELIQAVDKFMHITARDVLEGLDMDQPMKAVQLPFATLFGWVLSLPVSKPETMPIPEETHLTRCSVEIVGQGPSLPLARTDPVFNLLTKGPYCTNFSIC